MLEALMVALADKLWKGKRVADLEERLLQRLCLVTGAGFGDLYAELEPASEEIAREGDDRLRRSAV